MSEQDEGEWTHDCTYTKSKLRLQKHIIQCRLCDAIAPSHARMREAFPLLVEALEEVMEYLDGRAPVYPGALVEETIRAALAAAKPPPRPEPSKDTGRPGLEGGETG